MQKSPSTSPSARLKPMGGSGGPWVMPQEWHNFSCRSVGLSLPREGTFPAGAGDRDVSPVRERVAGS